jgi:hypothetical protein
MTLETNRPGGEPAVPRVFLHELGWRIGQKVGSMKEFCSMQAPGQDFYHRLVDGELFVYSGEERLCLPCAERRGLLSLESRSLRQPIGELDLEAAESSSEYDVQGSS